MKLGRRPLRRMAILKILAAGDASPEDLAVMLGTDPANINLLVHRLRRRGYSISLVTEPRHAYRLMVAPAAD